MKILVSGGMVNCDVSPVYEFCAMRQVHSFRADDLWKIIDMNKSWDALCASLKDIISVAYDNADRLASIIICDTVDGVFGSWMFNEKLLKPFTITNYDAYEGHDSDVDYLTQLYTVKPLLSPEFVNPNSDSTCRTLQLIVERDE